MSAHLPLWWGQGSIFTMVLMIMAMQVPVRGLVFGKCKRGCGCGKSKSCTNTDGGYWKEMATFLRKYHGYYIGFCVTYSWYYVVLEASWGHLSGTMNLLCIFWQIVTMYTPTHRNKWWCLACEFIVILHGPLIAM
jgi:hypothetical protein